MSQNKCHPVGNTLLITVKTCTRVIACDSTDCFLFAFCQNYVLKNGFDGKKIHIKNQSTENRKSYKINSNKSFYSKPNGLLLRITTHFIPTLAGNKISKWNQNDFCKRKRFAIRKKTKSFTQCLTKVKVYMAQKMPSMQKKTKEKKINRNVHPNENACS